MAPPALSELLLMSASDHSLEEMIRNWRRIRAWNAGEFIIGREDGSLRILEAMSARVGAASERETFRVRFDSGTDHQPLIIFRR